MMTSTETILHADPPRGAFDAASQSFRDACRLFPGFASLPTPVLVSLEPYAHLFGDGASVLQASDREAIAAAVALVVANGAADFLSVAPAAPRAAELERFATKMVARSFAVEGADLERLARVGLTPDQVAAAAEVAIAYHVVARLTAAARGRRPAVCEALTAAARKSVAAA